MSQRKSEQIKYKVGKMGVIKVRKWGLSKSEAALMEWVRAKVELSENMEG